MVTFYGLVFCCAAGYISFHYFNELKWLLIVPGILFFLFFSFHYFRKINSRKIFIFFVWVIFFLWVINRLYNSAYQTPVYLELMLTGNSNADTLFHSSISGMIQTFGIPSTGLNGIPSLRYHLGSHWVIANLSSLLNISTFAGYNVIFPVIIVPLFYKTYYLLIDQLRSLFYPKRWDVLNIRFWIISFVLVIGFLPDSFLRNIYIYWDEYQIMSESYTISLIIIFVFLSSAIIFWENYLNGKNNFFFLLIFIPLSIVFVGVSKISTMVILFVFFSYLFLRFDLYKKIEYLMTYFLIIAASFVIYYLTNDSLSATENNIRFMAFHKDYVKSNILYFFLYYLPVTGYIIFRLYILIINEFNKLKTDNLFEFFWKTVIKEKKLFDAETILVLCVAGSIPGFFLSIPSPSMQYFIDPVIRISLLLLLVHVIEYSSRFDFKYFFSRKSIYKIFLLLLLSLLFIIRYDVDVINKLAGALKTASMVKKLIKVPVYDYGKQITLTQTGDMLYYISPIGRQPIIIKDNKFILGTENILNIPINNASSDLIMVVEMRRLNDMQKQEKNIIQLIVNGNSAGSIYFDNNNKYNITIPKRFISGDSLNLIFRLKDHANGINDTGIILESIKITPTQESFCEKSNGIIKGRSYRINKKYSLLKILESIGKKPLKDKRKSIIYVPKTNRVYWTMSNYNNAAPFIAPALTGIPMFDGLPETDIRRLGYGYHTYDRNDFSSVNKYGSISDVYTKIISMGFERLIVIEETPDGIKKMEYPVQK
jgi:hypothetical protein